MKLTFNFFRYSVNAVNLPAAKEINYRKDDGFTCVLFIITSNGREGSTRDFSTSEQRIFGSKT